MVAEAADMPGTLPALVERRAGIAPEALAVREGERSLTYAELDAAATRLARTLRDTGVGAEDVVGVHTGRGPRLVVALLGVLKAGAAFLALPRDLPAARLATLTEDAGATALVTAAELRATLPQLACPALVLADDAPESFPVPHEAAAGTGIDPAHAAYVLYTSGSTGVPKGVVVEHGAAAAHVRAMADRIGLAPGDEVLQMAGESFDVALEQLFVALASGATVVLRGDEPWGPAELCAELGEGRITVADLPTALFAELVSAPEAYDLPEVFARVHTVLVGGEAFPSGALDRWRAAFASAGRAPRVGNAYGPTEAVMTATLWLTDPATATTSDGAEAPAVHAAPTGVAATATATAPDSPDADSRHAAARSVPVGTVVAPRALRLLDGELEPVGCGSAGELYVGGAALARGYLGRPDLTAARFVPDPEGPPGSRMYRTGDRMTEADDGELTFAGRVDDQLKIRGFRIEPGEIEAALVSHPAVGQAAVTADGDRLVGHLVSAEAGSRLPVAALRDWLGQRLPGWMVPAAWAWHDRLPVTASGKVDRAALPTPGADRADAGRPYEPPRDATQRSLCAVWARVLNLPYVGVDDDFFALGGTSLLAARALADIRTELAADLPLRALFAAPTPRALGETLARGTDGAPTLPPVVRGEPCDTAPLSLMQRQVWVVEQFSPDSSAYNAPTTLRLHGPLDLALLEESLTEIVRRHEILRTSVEERDGEPHQIVHEPYAVHVPELDLREEPDPEAAAEQFVRTDIKVRFDIGTLPLIRWTALRLAEQSWELVLVEHHLVHDGWSFALLVDELSGLYTALAEGRAPEPPAPAPRYQDFARWQREVREGPAMRAQLDHWKRRLAGAPQHVELPYDGPRAEHDDTRGAVHRMELPADLCARLREHSRENGATLFMTMLAGYAALLHRYSGQDEVCVGSAFGNRGVPGTAGVLGMFVNPVVLRCAVRGAGEPEPGFADLVERARGVVLDAQANQELPFVELVRELDPPRTPGRNPVFQTMLNFDDSPLSELRLGPVAGSYLERNNGTAKLDLSVLVVPRAERQLGTPSAERDRRITLIWEYRTDLFTPETIERLAQGYAELLDAALADPEAPVAELPVGPPVTTAAGADASDEAPAPSDETPARDATPSVTGETTPAARRARTRAALGTPATVPELFAAAVARDPEAVAVTEPGGVELTYGRLDGDANRIAHALAARGVGPGDIVGLHLPRSAGLVTAMLGVLKAGAAYLPLDADGPTARLTDVLDDARPRLVLTSSASVQTRDVPVLHCEAPEITGADPTDPGVPLAPGALAYVIYTSGSTGRPKGVCVPHLALADKYRAWELAYGLDGPTGTHLQMASPVFDVCTGDVFRALLSGGRLVLCPPDTLLEPARLLALLRDERVDYAEFLPSVLRLLVDHAERAGELLPPARLFAVGGEAWSGEDHRRFRAALPEPTRLLNVYGVTEATVGNTCHRPTGRETGVLPIGGPLPGVRAVVLDAAGLPVAPGVVGEIFLGGTGLARGYHGDPERTALRFLPDPDPALPPGSRRYATGDLGRHRPDGVIEFLGRRDDQVKVRGFRVEPAEVEQALREHPAVAEAVVTARTGADGVRLVAHCTAASVPTGVPATLDVVAEEARNWLRGRVPGYLVPSALVVLPALPRTASGKIDRNALPEPDPAPRGEDPDHAEPRTQTERAVARIWQQVLGVERVGLRDDFFDLGGHSLLAVRMVARLRAELDLVLTVRDLITEATVEGVAGRAVVAPEGGGPALAPRSRKRVDPTRFDQQESAG